MKKKEENIELEIYELLGIKTFKKILFKLVLPITLKIVKKVKRNYVYNKGTNYNMKKGHGIQDLEDFKKMLFLNAELHMLSLILCMPGFLEVIFSTASLFTTITTLFFIPINIYCIMLQRYNYIRINQVIKKVKSLEEAKKSKLKDELYISEHTNKIVDKHDKEKDITSEKFRETSNYEQLKQYRDYLSKQKVINEEQKSYNTVEKQPNIVLQLTQKIEH